MQWANLTPFESDFVFGIGSHSHALPDSFNLFIAPGSQADRQECTLTELTAKYVQERIWFRSPEGLLLKKEAAERLPMDSQLLILSSITDFFRWKNFVCSVRDDPRWMEIVRQSASDLLRSHHLSSAPGDPIDLLLGRAFDRVVYQSPLFPGAGGILDEVILSYRLVQNTTGNQRTGYRSHVSSNTFGYQNLAEFCAWAQTPQGIRATHVAIAILFAYINVRIEIQVVKWGKRGASWLMLSRAGSYVYEKIPRRMIQTALKTCDLVVFIDGSVAPYRRLISWAHVLWTWKGPRHYQVTGNWNILVNFLSAGIFSAFFNYTTKALYMRAVTNSLLTTVSVAVQGRRVLHRWINQEEARLVEAAKADFVRLVKKHIGIKEQKPGSS